MTTTARKVERPQSLNPENWEKEKLLNQVLSMIKTMERQTRYIAELIASNNELAALVMVTPTPSYGYFDDPRWEKARKLRKNGAEAKALTLLIRQDYGLEPVDLSKCEVIRGQ